MLLDDDHVFLCFFFLIRIIVYFQAVADIVISRHFQSEINPVCLFFWERFLSETDLTLTHTFLFYTFQLFAVYGTYLIRIDNLIVKNCRGYFILVVGHDLCYCRT